MSEAKPGAIVETAHRYVLEDTHNPELIKKELELADRVATFLQQRGIESSKIILLDETKPEVAAAASLKDEWRMRLFIGRDISRVRQITPEDYEIWLESKYEKQANAFIERLKERIKSGHVEGLHVRLSGVEENRIKIGKKGDGQNISLVQKIPTAERGPRFIPSCSVLDAAIYEAKLTESSLAVTILPESFKEQQQEVQMLFKILGQEPAVIVLYFDPDTFSFTEAESWNLSHEKLAEELKELPVA